MSAFSAYLVKRMGYIGVTLLLISLIIFAITQLLPGNAAVMILGKQATEESIAAIEQQLGLNRAWYVQYFDWLVGFVTGDWGISFSNRQEVAKLIFPRLVRSAQLAAITSILVTVTAIPLGVLAAIKQDSIWDLLASAGGYVGVSLPEFVIGTAFIALFTGPVFQILPYGGYEPLSSGVVTWAKHLILPSVTLSIILTAHVMRLTRSEVVEVLRKDYVRSARLKGLSETKVISRHALRNGLLPTITLLTLNVGYLLGSIVVVEEVFTFPGLGRLLVRSIQARDLPVIQVTVMLLAIVYAFSNLTADVLYTYLDPRIEYGEEE
ncbi:ABC-type transport system permease protein (probable substrate dipeptides/oligopeptides) [Haloferax gibbonsii ATCC 33959]|uniref:ABC-type transport system permease protein (Probable substrate dipeptides/oligopeptides) n=1 Tax=Haloferax gibbonsii (strain ATCC 33959 / DSM 4427 / JCM 8863 / NBRC 102184 / NCIMB 2188 / Ma 2.38) TaxID=1227459 RepID=M0HT94_HALGM|nr:ABC transporter permease [Haloferax gibbonsii]ELZ86912.1 ABC-type transport system permease protein (probable substrate dipeptides/oligopeptides) [Haloferax gibbonsii ATCC 33959]